MLFEDAVKKVGRPPSNENQREFILDGAAKVFAQKGFDGASISDLAASVGMSKAAIYHYFPNKRELGDAIILRAMQTLVHTVTDKVAQETDARAQLQTFMVTHAGEFESNPHWFITMLAGFEAMSDGPMKSEAMELRYQYERFLRQILQTGIEQGTFREMDVSMAGRAVLSMLSWLARWYRPDGRLSAREIAMTYFEIISSGFEARI